MSVLEVTRRMHVYNRWANGRVLEAMSDMTPGELTETAPVAFGNLRGALWHMVGAQMGWLGTCSGQDTWSRLSVHDSESIDGLGEVLRVSGRMWSEFLGSLSEEQVLAPAELPMDENFRRSVGADLLKWTEEHGHRPRRPMWQSVLHVVNHATQHRAEIGIYLAQSGRSPDDLDYGTFEEYRAIHEDDAELGAIR
jgi:uncharacterized damage-inducible protein DinB